MAASPKHDQREADTHHNQTSEKNMLLGAPMTDKTRSSAQPRRIPRITRPEPGSLYDIMHDNAGASLYVLPICWSDIHTKLMGVRFVELDPINTPLPARRHYGDVLKPSQTATTLGRDLTTLLATDKSRWFLQIKSIKSIMSTFFPDTLSRAKTNTDLDLFFGDRVFKKAVRVPVLWHHPESAGGSFDSAITLTDGSTLTREHSTIGCGQATTKQPLLAYINRKQLKVIRANLFRVCPGPASPESGGAPTINFPVHSLQKLRSKSLIPAKDDHDAHYVSVLLAMAQAYFYSDEGSKSSSQLSSRSGFGRSIDSVPTQFTDITVRLIAHSDDPADFVVYTAIVTREFLERFAHPTKAPPKSRTGATAPSEDDSGLKISYVHVPIWPILGLRERLAKAIGRDIAGSVPMYAAATGDIETWHTSEELAEIKRQRREDNSLYQATRQLLSQGKKRRRSDKKDRSVLLEMTSSFEDNEDAASCASDDIPVLSPDAKRRCTRTVNPLEVC
jgi:hypothetical protein